MLEVALIQYAMQKAVAMVSLTKGSIYVIIRVERTLLGLEWGGVGGIIMGRG